MRETLFALGLALVGCGSYEGPADVDAKGGAAGSAGSEAQAGSPSAGGSAGTSSIAGSASGGGGGATAGATSEGGSSGQPAGGQPGKAGEGGKPAGGAPPTAGTGGASAAGSAGKSGGGAGGQAASECDCYELHLSNRAYCVASSDPKGFTCIQCPAQNADCDGDTIEPDIGSGCEVSGSSHCPL
jgi:hypothetical protein